MLILKITDEYPACVTFETKEKLLERGWAILTPKERLYDIEKTLNDKDCVEFAPDDTPRDNTDSDEISIHGYFSGYMDEFKLWDFSLSVDNEKLCAISDDAKIFQYEKSGE